MSRTITACTMDCPDACSLIVDRRNDNRISLRGNPDSPFTAGFTCPKIKHHIKRLQHPERIRHPLLRVNGTWQQIAWEAALDLCAEKIQALRSQPKAILHIKSDGAKGVLKAATALFFSLLGTSRTIGSLCDAAGYIAYVHDFGSRKNNDISDLTNAARIVNWGKDFSRSSVHTAAIIRNARKKGTRVLTISPGADGNDSFSDERIRIRPGTDRFLAAAVIRRLWRGRQIPSELLKQTKKPEKFLELISGWTPENLARACDVTLGDVEKLWRWYWPDRPTATFVGAGLQRYRYGGENVRFINALALSSGNIGISGGGSYYHLHAYGNLNLNWIRDPRKKSRRSIPIAAIGREIAAAQNPPIKLIWINGSNVVNQAPDTRQIVQAFDNVEFKVVADAFMNDTAQRADLILPSTLMLEQEDIIGSYLHEYVQHVQPALQPPLEARDDMWILREIGKRLDPPVKLPNTETCLQRSLNQPSLKVTLEQLRREGCAKADRPKIAYTGLAFDHPDGKYRFPLILHPEPPVDRQYPLRLLTLVRRRAIHSQILPEDQEDPPRIWVAPDNPLLPTIDPNKEVYVVSPLGRLKVTLEIVSGLHPAVVLYRRGGWMSRGGGVNQLIAAGLTDIGSGAPFYDQYVRLENS
ncbi:MAG: molybdopterin-dependent oxidoreductase [Desulfobacterales bacterium]|jgi:anaerobic selenocysteine-containing dehydrogenase